MSSTVPDVDIASLTAEQVVIWPVPPCRYDPKSPLPPTQLTIFAKPGHVLCIWALRSALWDIHLHDTVALFVLSTVFVINYTVYLAHGAVVRFSIVKNEDYDLFERYQNMDDFGRRFGSMTEEFLAVFLNIVAEWMLIHRCYHIWSSNKAVAIPLIVASVVINACGFAGSIVSSVGISALAHNPDVTSLMVAGDISNLTYIIASALNNLIITLLTAGRIWWIHRQVRARGVYTSDKFVQSISRFIFESGIIYPVINVVNLITVNTITPENFPFDTYPLVALSAGIAPTLIMVRAKLGKNVESLQEGVSEIRFTSQLAQSGLGETSITRSQAHIHSISNLATNVEGTCGGRGVGNQKETIMPV